MAPREGPCSISSPLPRRGLGGGRRRAGLARQRVEAREQQVPEVAPVAYVGARRRQGRHRYRFTFGHGRRRRGGRRRREALHELLAESRPFQLEPVPELLARDIDAGAGCLY